MWQYLNEDLEVAVRGFAEIRLIRLGELLGKPLHIRLAYVRSLAALAAIESAMPGISLAAAGWEEKLAPVDEDDGRDAAVIRSRGSHDAQPPTASNAQCLH